MNGVAFSRRMNMLLAPAAVAASVVALVAPGSVQAKSGGETAVSCGQTVKASVRLANDLLGCPESGLIVGADNITVDLNGHTIGGTNARKPGTAGVANDKHANVKILNGTIMGFYFSGVGVTDARGTTLSKLIVRRIGTGCRQGDTCSGIFLMQSPGTRVIDSTISNLQGNGIDVYASPSTRVEASHVDGNAGGGIEVFHSPKSQLVGNQLTGNKKQGIGVNSSSDSTWVTGNVARGNREVGIAVGASNHLHVLGNRVSGNGESGLLLFDLTSSLVRGNQASGNPTGIVLYGGQSGYAGFGGKHGATHNQLVANNATKNARSGIFVRGDGGKDVASNNLLSRNVANGNGRDGGIVLQGSASGNKLRDNTANANAGHGITATPGTIDAGGNRAHGNHRSPQCVGVACR
jgi:parallel beta-helix repeat protein